MNKRISKSLVDGVYNQLRSDVISSRLLPSQKLRIAKLAEELGVSIGAVRESLARLAAEGLIVAEAQKGYHVAPVSAKDLLHLTDARVAIESLCLQRAIAVGGTAWEAEIIAAAYRLSRIPERPADDAQHASDVWTTEHAIFHEKIVAACDNPWLLRLRHQLYEHSERYRTLSIPAARAERDIKSEHDAIVKAVLDRDIDKAINVLSNHINNTTKIILNGNINLEYNEGSAV